MQVKQKNLAVGALAAVLVLVLWYMMLYSPMKHAASKARSDAKDTQTQIDTLEAQVRKAGGAPGSQSAKQRLAELQTMIPATPRLADFLRTLDSIRTSSGVTFQSVSPSPSATATTTTSTITVSITISGQYAQVVDYLRGLATMPRLFVVDNVAFAAGNAAGTGSANGGPVGTVFAGVGAAPSVQLQITGRMFTAAPTVPASGTTHA